MKLTNLLETRQPEQPEFIIACTWFPGSENRVFVVVTLVYLSAMNDKKVDDAILGYNIIISTVHTLKEKRLLLLFVLNFLCMEPHLFLQIF